MRPAKRGATFVTNGTAPRGRFPSVFESGWPSQFATGAAAWVAGRTAEAVAEAAKAQQDGFGDGLVRDPDPLLDLTAVPQRELEALRSGLLELADVLRKEGL